jgi:TusA-related sulfurtransferase
MPNRAQETSESAPDFFLDITAEVCPLTFVRTKLLIERMAAGQTADVLLKGAEPLANVPRAVADQGHTVLALVPVSGQNDTHRLRLRKERPRQAKPSG